MSGGPPRVAQVANFMGATTGGLRVVVDAIGEAHVRGGGERLLVVPAATASVRRFDRDTRVTVASPLLPLSGNGYHVLVDRRAVIAALEWFAPQVVEVHDQTTLAWVAGWARSAGVPSMLFAHERLDRVASMVWPRATPMLDRAGRRWSAHLAERFDAVICASRYAAEPFAAAGVRSVHRIPFGVDLQRFTPDAGQESAHQSAPAPAMRWRDGAVRLVFAGRLYPEKAPDVALDVVRELIAAGGRVDLAVVGHGPMDAALQHRVRRDALPVHFLGHLPDRGALATVLAQADVALSPGPRETFGLSVLEALACGTPVVVHADGASRELVTPATGRVAHSAAEMALAVQQLVGDPVLHAAARVAARRRAEEFSWQQTAASLCVVRSELLRAGLSDSTRAGGAAGTGHGAERRAADRGRRRAVARAADPAGGRRQRLGSGR